MVKHLVGFRCMIGATPSAPSRISRCEVRVSVLDLFFVPSLRSLAKEGEEEALEASCFLSESGPFLCLQSETLYVRHDAMSAARQCVDLPNSSGERRLRAQASWDCFAGFPISTSASGFRGISAAAWAWVSIIQSATKCKCACTPPLRVCVWESEKQLPRQCARKASLQRPLQVDSCSS